MNLKTTLILLFISISLGKTLNAKEINTKFGKVSIEELKQNICPIDSSAHAYFLFDFGNTTFEYATTTIRESEAQSDQKGFQLRINRHFRLKILDSEAFSLGDINIKLYKRNDIEENLLSIDAYTYTLNNEKIVKTKLSNKDIFQEETSENITTAKFAMPNLQDGCIIEVEYTIKSDFLYNLQDWYFQKSVPVLQSLYKTSIPEYYVYNHTVKGYYPIQIETSQARKTIKINYIQDEFATIGSGKTTYTSTFNYYDTETEYSAENIPAFPDEKFLKSTDNYISKVEFEISYTKFPDQSINYYTTTWEEIDSDLLKDDAFGANLSDSEHLNNEISTLKNSGASGVDLLNNALSLMKNKMTWNGEYGKYLTDREDKVYANGIGNSADINLNLVTLLRGLDFFSYPVILSTQDNGIIMPSHPSSSSFNYVIAMVSFNNQVYLLDATDQNSLVNLIPIRCLNDQGRIIGQTSEKWINLMNYKTYTSQSICNLTFDNNLNLSGTIQKRLKEYAAYNFKTEFNRSDDIADYVKSFEENNSVFEIDDLNVEGIDSSIDEISLIYNISASNFATVAGDVIYFSTAIDPFFNENPFKLEKREFPVEFNFPYTVQRTYSFKIPESYEVNELPESISLNLPENAGNFYYQVQQMNDIINVNFYFLIKKSQFLTEEYDQLKSFFQMIVDKQNELIVLKKG